MSRSSSSAIGMNGGELTPLQKHVSFFDRNKDGVIYPWETFQGFRAIGCGVGLSTVSAAFINGFLGPKTCKKWKFILGDLHRTKITCSNYFEEIKKYTYFYRRFLAVIRASLHASREKYHHLFFRFMWKTFTKANMGVTQVSMTPREAKFEEIFQRHAHVCPNALTSDELQEMLREIRVPKDYTGWLASTTEWMILYSLCKDKNGLLHKETVRAAYDGSLFLQMERERASSRKKAR